MKVKKVSQIRTEEASSDTDSLGRILERVNQANQGEEEKYVWTKLHLVAMDHGRRCSSQAIYPLVDTGVYRTILCGQDWQRMKKADPSLRPKRCRVNFTPYGTRDQLDMIGRTKAILKNEAGGQVDTIVYIAKGGHQSLLGLKDARNLGIISVNKEGEVMKGLNAVNNLHVTKKQRKRFLWRHNNR